MNRNFDKFLGILTVSALILANTAMSFAEGDETPDFEGLQEEAQEITEETPEEISFEEVEVKQQDFLTRLKAELNLSKTDYRQILNSIATTKAKLLEVTEHKVTLEQQLQNLENNILSTKQKLLDVIKQVIEKENQVRVIYDEIEIKEVSIAYQKELLKDYIRVLYQEENEYFSFTEDGGINTFKLLLADGSVGDNMTDIKYFDLLNEAGMQILYKLEDLAAQLQKYKVQLNKERGELIGLQENLEKDKAQLDLQKQSKDQLFKLTQGQEDVYTKLLEQTLSEQEQKLSDIQKLGQAVLLIEQKILEDGADFNPDDYDYLLDYKTQALLNFHMETMDLQGGEFMWPSDPDRGISAYFRDASYAASFGMGHNAVDIPAYQGSAVRSAADGVVYTVAENGYGYSYIIIAHAGGFMTVYGHISSMLVEEGDLLAAGAIIGLSGGMPGTYGAGYMTTGPHLHFEMLLNGSYVDPLYNLPLEKLTEEQMEALPEKYFDDWEEAVAGMEFVGIER